MTSNNINREISRNLDALVRNNKIPIPYSINIVVDLSSNKSINNIFKSYGAITSNNDIQEAVDKVVNSKKKLGKINISTNSYSYLKASTPFGTKIAFIERSQYDTMLFELLKTFIVIGCISLPASAADPGAAGRANRQRWRHPRQSGCRHRYRCGGRRS